MKTESSLNHKFKYSGFLVTYNSSNRQDITQINHFLFGRVVTIQKTNNKERYYYPGLFEKLSFKKITNGCYFIREYPNFVEEEMNEKVLNTLVLINFIPATVEFIDDKFLTARQTWEDKIDGKVHNW